MSTLFREEVITRKAQAVFGEVVTLSGSLTAFLAFAAIALAGGIIALLVFGTYAPKERVSGYLAPSAGLVRVASPREGIVTAQHVAEGEVVQSGAPLFTVAAPVEAASGTDVDTAHLDALLEEHAILIAQAEREKRLSETAVRGLRARQDAARAQMSAIDAQRELVLQRTVLLERDVARLETLNERGHLAATLLDARLMNLIDARERAQVLEQEAARLREEFMALELEIEQIPLRFMVREAELRARSLAVERDLATAEARWSLVVRAPVAGRVSGMLVHPALAVTPGRTVLTLLPDGSRLLAELLVPTQAAGFVRAGQPVRLRYDAFPYQKFGLHGGSIVSVSRSVLDPTEQPGPVRVDAPVYRVIVELDAQSVVAYADDLPLQSGMTLQADILRDRRRIIEWLFDPVLAATRGL